ncbi:xylulokinase [Clostridia bacterium OttesenSCG-928-O13]|nr:xylulokinase [Clostridia bacterium OttesenSCG-928-O13]
MAYLMGIDLGTSSLKTLVIDETGTVLGQASRSYQYDSATGGVAQQEPDVWWDACVQTIAEALQKSNLRGEDITALSFSGQMHGVVMLDEKGQSVRPAILHNDARSAKQVDALNQYFGQKRICELMMNPVYTGFMLPSLLWVRENEPDKFEQVRKVCLPKDYIKYRLTGEVTTDSSDASATLLFDIRGNCWSGEIIRQMKLPEDIFPPVFDTSAKVGTVSEAAAAQTGLSPKTIVVAGGADAVMQGIGNGVTKTGIATANIGSSGQVAFQSDTPTVDPNLTVNTFCGYKKGRWITQGAIMHAGLSLKWFNSLFDKSDYKQLDAAAEKAGPGSGGLVFLPYLNGERTPHLNPNLSALFLGCTTSTTRAQMARSVMEGVSFALYQCMEVYQDLGLTAQSVVASGGGAQSPLWLQIQADVYGLPLQVATNQEQAALGAAIAAGVGAGVFASIEEGCASVVRYRPGIVEPSEHNHKIYLEYYSLFKDAYTANRELLQRATLMGRTLH